MTSLAGPPPGGRLPVVWHESYEVDIGPHVFPTAKYRLVRQRLMGERAPVEFHRPTPATDAEVLLVHTSAYVSKILEDRLSPAERLTLEVPFSPELRDASWLCAGGAALTARLALRHGVAVHLGGGFHHAYPDHGEGFCLINDVAVSIRVLQRAGAIARAMVVDCDVHHGNGTAAVFAGDESVFTFSIHQEHNYPADKPPSDVDVGLDDGVGDRDYLAALAAHIPAALDRHRPDL
ncbi:MAG TPA: histone deacetylase, partial [Gemmatimonadales bacterium]|nr:histone deacetylase [Gemmatimonadales bacterium]